jgi:ketopantoate reductase
MKILILGTGVIGTTLGVLLTEAGHDVQHVRRPGTGTDIQRIWVNLLDGRQAEPTWGKRLYEAKAWDGADDYAFCIVSVTADKVETALADLRARGLAHRLVLMCGLWGTRGEIAIQLGNYDFVVGYPVAGGRFDGDRLTSVVFKNVMLEQTVGAEPSREQVRVDACRAFTDAGLVVEAPDDMVAWIWTHMAINAGVVTTIASQWHAGELDETVEAALGDPAVLAECTRTAREALKIVHARGVPWSSTAREAWPFFLPSRLAGAQMVRMFQKDECARQVMLLHDNPGDLTTLVEEVVGTGRHLGVETPRLDEHATDLRRVVHAMQSAA